MAGRKKQPFAEQTALEASFDTVVYTDSPNAVGEQVRPPPVKDPIVLAEQIAHIHKDSWEVHHAHWTCVMHQIWSNAPDTWHIEMYLARGGKLLKSPLCADPETAYQQLQPLIVAERQRLCGADVSSTI